MHRAIPAMVFALCAAPAWAQGLHRFAVIAGNDRGGDGTRPLLYAVEDARRIHDVLTRLGGVQRDDAFLVEDGDAAALFAAFSRAEQGATAARGRGERTALIFYYSGHAKDGSLRLGDSRLPFDAVKARLSKAPADVRIGIFDSCRSGALTRTKGARRAPEFDVQSDAGRAAEGLVLLTSSTSDEDSQESDSLGGSYFTHYLASGLLGDADRSRDGRVTLAEAYAYAYDRTVADTSGSTAGAQHPTFSYDLAGNGDLVITDVASHQEGLEFPAAAPPGVYYLVNDEGLVVTEVWKERGEQRRIAVSPGRYRLRRRLEDHLRIGELQVGAGQIVAVDEGRLRDAPFSDDPVKGGALGPEPSRTTWALALSYQSFADPQTRSVLFPPTSLLAVESISDRFLVRNLRLAYDFALGSRSALLQLPTLRLDYKFTEFNAGASLIWEMPWGSVVPFVGARAALMVMVRQFDSGNVRFQSLFTASPGIVAGARMQLAPRWGVLVRGRLQYFLYNIDGTRNLGFWELGAMVTYDL